MEPPSAGKQIDGLNLQVPSTNNTGTNGGINRATYARSGATRLGLRPA